MKLVGFVCNQEMGVENPSYASKDPFEVVRVGDAYKIFEHKGFKWIEIMDRQWIYEGDNGPVYTQPEWEEAHNSMFKWPE